MPNLEAKVPLEKWAEAKSAAWSAYTAASPKLRSVHCASEAAPRTPHGDPHHQSARAAVRRRAPALESDPTRIRRASGDEVDVRRVAARVGVVARHSDYGVRVAATELAMQRIERAVRCAPRAGC